MSKNVNVLKEIVATISRSGMRSDELTSDMNLVEDLGMDSIQLIQLVVAIETELDIELNEDQLDLSNLVDLSKLMSIVQQDAT
ncbi:TPA: acyl carrier protein [Vibrio parahaemolyticus]|jgi:acyl carrier protein|nr:acyl carrier protein [Vibrio parahaemolyticus]